MLPTDQFEELVEAGISADDSEQRSLAIEELARAPAVQVVGGLSRILREDRDHRSRRTALDVLIHLPAIPAVAEKRRALLEMLTADSDTNIAETARAAAANAG